jgi:asparagine synthase (glutamine-hydrolysing)
MIFGFLNRKEILEDSCIDSIINYQTYPLFKKQPPIIYSDTQLCFLGDKSITSSISISQKYDRYVLIAWARIDNKVDLAKRLSENEATLSTYSSAEIILKTYLKYGKDCVKHLNGDWSFVLWDKQEEELFLARDHIGYATLYYYKDSQCFIFSSHLKTLLAHPKVPKELNPNAILQLGVGLKRDGQSFYKDIFQLPSAHYLILTKKQLTFKNYWLPTEIEPIRYSNDEDYVYHFLELYKESVTARIDTEQTGMALSSGLDSSTLAALALPKFAKQGRKLDAFTWQPNVIDKEFSNKGNILDEVPLTKRLVEDLGGIDHHIVRSQFDNVLTTIKQSIDIFAEPITVNVHYSEVIKGAYQENIQVLLDGAQGNFTISHYGDASAYFNSLMTKSNTRSFFDEIWKWKKNQKKSWLHIFHNLCYQPILDYVEQISNKNQNDFPESRIKRGYLNKQAVKDHLPSYEAFTPELETLGKSTIEKRLRSVIELMQSNISGTSKIYHNHFGMEVRTPAIDIRLLKFCLGLPNHQYIGNGHPKYILKRAMKGKVPDYILFQSQRGMQASNQLSKFKKEAVEIQETIETLKKSPLASYWLDFKKLEEALAIICKPSLAEGIHPFLYIHLLEKGLSLGLFLQKFENGEY